MCIDTVYYVLQLGSSTKAFSYEETAIAPMTFCTHCVQNLMILDNSDQLFAAKHLTYLPTQEELRREIEQQKEFFRLQN